VKSSDSPDYIPQQGDTVWINFMPQVGREQAGRRPAIIVSPLKYNRRVGLTLLCPITTKAKGYPFEVVIPEGLAVSGVVLADQVKSFDWRERNAEFLCKMPPEVTVEVINMLRALMPLPTASSL
jgi:mRNA interferase MazF